MPQPRRPAPAPARQPPPAPRQPQTIGAQFAAATATPAGLLATSTIVGALTAAELRAIVSATVNALRKASSVRLVALVPIAQRAAAPIRPLVPGELSPAARASALTDLARAERDREMTFRRRQLVRVRRDLPRVLALTDDRRRQERLRGLLGREAHYTRLRLDAIAGRAVGLADSLNVEQASPDGAVWQLGRTVHHTPGCLFLHGHALAWGALRAAGYIPPVHLRCDCRLRTLDAALTEGLLRRRMVPTDDATAVLIARAQSLDVA